MCLYLVGSSRFIGVVLNVLLFVYLKAIENFFFNKTSAVELSFSKILKSHQMIMFSTNISSHDFYRQKVVTLDLGVFKFTITSCLALTVNIGH